MQPIKMWNRESISTFKILVNNVMVVNFIEELSLSDHSFGLLKVELNSGETINVNDKLLECNFSMKTDRFAEGNYECL